jgi:hypothetical protein
MAFCSNTLADRGQLVRLGFLALLVELVAHGHRDLGPPLGLGRRRDHLFGHRLGFRRCGFGLRLRLDLFGLRHWLGLGFGFGGDRLGHRLGLLFGRFGLGFDLFGRLLRLGLGLGYWLGFLLLEQNQLDRDDGIPGRLDEGRQAEGEQQDHGGVQCGRQHDALARRSQPGSDRALNLRQYAAAHDRGPAASYSLAVFFGFLRRWPLGSSVIMATRVKPATLTLPMTSMTRP